MFEDIKRCYLLELKNKMEDLMREEAELEYDEKKEK